MKDFDKQELEAIGRVAQLLTARHSHTDTIAATLEAEILEVASHTPSSGGVGSKEWVASLKSFGKILLAIAEREETKLKAMGI